MWFFNIQFKMKLSQTFLWLSYLIHFIKSVFITYLIQLYAALLYIVCYSDLCNKTVFKTERII